MNKTILASFEIENLEQLTKDTGELIKRNEQLKASAKELDKTTSQGATEFAKLNAQIKANNKDISTNTKLIQATTGVTRGLNVELGKEINTIAQARASNTALLNLRNQLNLNTKEGVSAAKRINEQLDRNNAFIKENVSAYEKQKIGIGDYTNAIKDAFKETGGFNTILGGLQQTLSTFAPITNIFKSELNDIREGYKNATSETNGLSTANKALQKANALSTASFKVLKLAIASTGIGLLLIALGSLVTFLSKTQAGIDKVTSVTRPLQAIFQSLIGVGERLGQAIFETFSNPKQALLDLGNLIKNNLINRFTAFGKILDGILTLDFNKVADGALQAATGVEDLTGKISKASAETSEFLKDAIDAGKEIDRLKKQEEISENNLIVLRSEQNKIIKEQNKIAEDTTKTASEREAAAIRSIEASKSLLTAEQALLDLQIERKNIENSLNDTSRADQKELNELVAKRNEAETRALELQTTQTNKLNTIRREQIAIAKKATEQAIKDNETRLNLFISENESNAKTLDERLAFENEVFKKSSENLELKLKNDNASQEEAELARLELKQEFLDKQTALVIENADQELALFLQQNKTRLEQGQLLTDQLLAQELERINKIEAETKKRLELDRENKLISELEFLTKKSEQEDEFNSQREEIQKQKEAQDKALQAEQLAIDFENKLLRLEEEDATLFEIERERVARDREVALMDAEENIQDEKIKQQRINQINAESARANENIKKEETAVRVNAAQEAFGNIAKLLGEETKAGKIAGIAQATISTYQGVTRVWETPSTLPEPYATISKALSTATVLASGLQSVRKIRSTPVPRAEKGLEVSSGGLLQGRRHSAGGILIEAEDGEMIMNRKATSMFLPQLRKMQEIGNGNTGIIRNNFAMDGGVTARSLTNSIREVAVTNLQDLRVINVASDTLNVATEENIIVQNANI